MSVVWEVVVAVVVCVAVEWEGALDCEPLRLVVAEVVAEGEVCAEEGGGDGR